MKKENYIKNTYDGLEKEYKDTSKRLNNNAVNGTFLTTLFVLPALALSGSGLIVMPALASFSILVPTMFIGSSIRQLNRRKYIDDREDNLDLLSNKNKKVNQEYVNNEISFLKSDNADKEMMRDNSKFMARYSEAICALFALLSIPLNSITGFSICSFVALLSSIISEISYSSYDRENNINNAKIDSYNDILECNYLEDIDRKRTKANNIMQKKISNALDKQYDREDIKKIVDEYVDSLTVSNENESSKELIKTK